MPTDDFFLMNSDLVATPFRRDAAQGAEQQALYDEFFETCLAHGTAKLRRQQIKAIDPATGGALNVLAPIEARRVALLEPLIDGLR